MAEQADVGVTCRKEPALGPFRLPDPRYDTWGFSWVGSRYLAGAYPGLVVPEWNDDLAATVRDCYHRELEAQLDCGRTRQEFKRLWFELMGSAP